MRGRISLNSSRISRNSCRTSEWPSAIWRISLPHALIVSDYDDKHVYNYSYKGGSMRTVQMTLEDELVTAVDRAARRLKTTRSAFARDALRSALQRLRLQELERKHREGYAKKPVKRGEFDIWEREQVWGL